MTHTLSNPMSEYPQTITTEQLAKCLEDPDLKIVQVNTPGPMSQSFISGAVWMPPSWLVDGTPPASGRLPSLERLNQVFGAIGYDAEQVIVVADDEGGGWAGRLAWTLDIIGHHRWLYLDGGIHAWAAAGLQLGNQPNQPTPTTPDLKIDHAPIAELDDVRNLIDKQGGVIWDCRSQEEFAGVKIQAKRGGHIPSAVNLDWLDLMDRHRNLRLVEDLEDLLAQHGIRRDMDVITHCQTHHRSGLTYMAARLLGFSRIRAYHGSWSEWGNRDDTPIETGMG